MPRETPRPPLARPDQAPGGAAAVDRALSLLAAFRTGDGLLTLATLADRTQLYKSTVLRLLASLVNARMVHRASDGRYGLGPEIARLHSIYSASFSLEAQVLPVLQALVDRTQESAALHVRQGDQRLCLLRVDSPHPLRDHVRAGDVLPLERGAGGRVLLAFAGKPGKPYDRIRRDGLVVLSGDRVPGLTGIAAPVWGPDGALVGALTLTLPTPRLQASFTPAVQDAAVAASRAIGGRSGLGCAPDGEARTG